MSCLPPGDCAASATGTYGFTYSVCQKKFPLILRKKEDDYEDEDEAQPETNFGNRANRLRRFPKWVPQIQSFFP